MGGITRTLFGGSKQKSGSTSFATNESGNLSYPYISNTFAPIAGRAIESTDHIGRMLGLYGGYGRGAQEQFLRETPGYQFAQGEGLRAIDGSRAGMGLFNSGGTMKDILRFSQGLADQTYGSYMDRLFNASRQNFDAANLITQAGQYSRGESSSSSFGKGSSQDSGAGAFLGALLASDPEVKKNIVKIGEFPDGLGIYEYEYINPNEHGEGVFTGVMADEVQKFRPWALGPVIDGIQTVDYSKLEGDD